MKRFTLLALIIISLTPRTISSLSYPEQQLPFEINRNKVILPVRINDSRPLKIILDSGMPGHGVLLFKKELQEELKLEARENAQIHGAGQGKESHAVITVPQTLKIAESSFDNQPVIILQNDTMSHFPTDGVIGNTIFGPHAVHFDFEKKIITLNESGSFIPDQTWNALDMTFNDHGIPFIDAAISVQGEKEVFINIYIDSASSEALELLVRPDQKFILPEKLETRYLGRGLSGDINGLFGKVAVLRLGSFILTDVPTAFPKAEVRSRQPGADGILCNNSLLRFYAVFDFNAGKLYLKPNSRFKEPYNSNYD